MEQNYKKLIASIEKKIFEFPNSLDSTPAPISEKNTKKSKRLTEKD